MNIVWLKKDLRVSDHQPLKLASIHARQSKKPLLLLYLIEPTLLASPDCAPQHHQFAMECLIEIAGALPECCKLMLVKADAELAFPELLKAWPYSHVFSHQETGNWLSFERDKQVAKIISSNGCQWHQFQTNAVIRGRVNRDEWSKFWLDAMTREPFEPELEGLTESDEAIETLKRNNPTLSGFKFCFLDSQSTNLPNWAYWDQLFLRSGQKDKPHRQKGGRLQAEAALKSFFEHRGMNYRKAMSSPLSAPEACSRISPYLTFGVFSIFEVAQCIQRARHGLSELSPDLQSAWKMSLKSFESRLHWHCHFIQKLETEPELEFLAVHRQLDGLRNKGALSDIEKEKLRVWIEGKSGFPMIDACMRMLRNTGWINFRMRAMLVAFASYQLWLDWRHTAPLLAQQFLDYEPGIHYPQFQMQSGVTGINTMRIYNPVKQAKDHDPEACFIKRWLPELAQLPPEFAAEPWKLPAILAQDLNFIPGVTYPQPIVDPLSSIGLARNRISQFRQGLDLQKEANRVYQKHGSRHPSRNGKPAAKKSKVANRAELELSSDVQMKLFED